MKSVIFICFFIISISGYGQKILLKIAGQDSISNKIIDSVSYQNRFKNLKEASIEAKMMLDLLNKSGYLESTILESKKANDSIFEVKISVGKKTKNCMLYIGRFSVSEKKTLFQTEKDSLNISFNSLETFLSSTIKKLEKLGFSFAKLKLERHKLSNRTLYADLIIDYGHSRKLDEIVISGVEKFPEGFKRSVFKNYKNKTFNQDLVKKIHVDFGKFRFVKPKKYPEILFTIDSTKLYVYLEKSKSNRFEGFIGFSNAKEKTLNFIGYLDLALSNALNIGEELKLYWKSDGNNQTTLNAAIDFPFIFKSPIGIKADLNIFRRDSLFQNTKKNIDIGYLFDYSSRLYLGYQSTESSTSTTTLNSRLGSYTNTFFTTRFEYGKFNNEDLIFPEKLKIETEIGVGSRTTYFETNNQFYAAASIKYNLNLNSKNSLYFHSEHYFLNSDSYITNELHRFGGIHSIRGFAENSLQGNQLQAILTEYRYLVSPNLYVHSLVDYGTFTDKTNYYSDTVLGLGFGFGILTKNGLLHLIYANGSAKNQDISLSNSIVHLSFKSYF